MTSDIPGSVDDIMETAAHWFAQVESGEADMARFEIWRGADPSHAAAYARVYASVRQMEKLRGLTKPSPAQPTRRAFVGSGTIAAGVAAIAAVGGFAVWGIAAGRANAQTGIGERRAVPLPGGDHIELNTDSKVEWPTSRGSRELWLKRGEVAVTVGGGDRPFQLRAGKHEAQLGAGEYIARLRETSLDIISLAGTATVRDDAGATITIQPQQAAILTSGSDRVRPVSTDDIHFLTGWRSDELVLNGQVLSEVVEEYNRYLDRKIIIANPELGGIQLGGRFTNRDPSKLLAGLEASFGIHVTQESHSVILSK